MASKNRHLGIPRSLAHALSRRAGARPPPAARGRVPVTRPLRRYCVALRLDARRSSPRNVFAHPRVLPFGYVTATLRDPRGLANGAMRLAKALTELGGHHDPALPPGLRRSTPAVWNRVSARTTVAPSVSSRRSAVPRPLTGLTPSGTDDGPAGRRPRGPGPGRSTCPTPAAGSSVASHPSRAPRIPTRTARRAPEPRGRGRAFSPGSR